MLDYSKILSPTVTSLKKSGIRKFFDLLEEMDNVVSLTVGQPDFVTPWHIREAGIESLERGKTYYTSNAGTLELRREISAYLSRRFGLMYDPKKEIIVTIGGSEAIDMTIRSIVTPGDYRHLCTGPLQAHAREARCRDNAEDQAACAGISQQPHRRSYDA